VGIAGSVTPLSFTLASSNASLNSDFVVLQKDNCLNAHLAVTGINSLASISVDNLQVQTVTTMTEAGSYTICYATVESRGNSNDDFVALDVPLNQISPPNVVPRRMVLGSTQNFNVSNGSPDDQFGWIQDDKCDRIADPNNAFPENHIQTARYT